jgi:hypothetical protein
MQKCLVQCHSLRVIKDIQMRFPDDPDVAVELLKKFKTEPPQNSNPVPLDDFWIGAHTFHGNDPVPQLHVHTNEVAHSCSG